jgi:hypothetical protein
MRFPVSDRTPIVLSYRFPSGKTMTALYLDTEYNGFGGSLISMALVADDERFFYEVLFGDYNPSHIDVWVRVNVLPVINRKPVPLYKFRTLLSAFLTQFQNPMIICNGHEDLKHFCNMFEGPEYGSSLNYPFMAQVLTDANPKSKIPHNALEDARALREWCLTHSQ